MRKLLNRPWFVALLVLGALAVVVYSLREPERHFAPPTPEDELAAAPADGEAAGETPATVLATDKALEALPIPRTFRDPFAVPPKPEHAAAADAGPAPVEIVDRLALTAVWTQGAFTFVLLNDRICQAGEKIGRFTIESIVPDGVWVRHDGRRDFVGFGAELTVKSFADPAAAPALSAL